MDDRYVAGIVLYNPDLDRLKLNLDALYIQVTTVYCFDNGSENLEEIKVLLKSYQNVRLIDGKFNRGIATALNMIVQQAAKEKASWCLTLDQDSVVCEDMVQKLASLKDGPNVAIISPIVKDVRRKNEVVIEKTDTVTELDFCITSGSFMSVEKLLQVGGFDDYLFIGLVDNEICMRMRQYGYKILRNNAVVLDHELGELKPSKYAEFYLKLGDILHSEMIKKLSYKRKVNPVRVYYGIRNAIYLDEKYKSSVVYKNRFKIGYIIKNIFFSYFRGGAKWSLLKAAMLGIRDGRMKVRSLRCS